MADLPQEASEPDVDHDGTLEIEDQCIDEPETINGSEDHDGCPDGPPIGVHDVMQAFPFSPKSAALSSGVKAYLDLIAGSMGWYEGRAATFHREITIRVLCSPGDGAAAVRLERRRKAAIIRRLRSQGVRELYFDRPVRLEVDRTYLERVRSHLAPNTCIAVGVLQDLSEEEEVDPQSAELAITWEDRNPDYRYWHIRLPPLKAVK